MQNQLLICTSLCVALAAAFPIHAQTPAAPEPAPPQTPAAGQQVDVTGGRESDTEQRRRATAAKIVIGREEIEKFGDSTLGEVLRRLPGITTPGAPGRGGPPRMRGLGSGYTQILIDGQPAPRGFSIESLTPEQVERIEILRAPTAETGARAIAGTIHIVTREGFRRRLNDLRLGTSLEDGRHGGGGNWTHNDSAGPLTYNIAASLFRNQRGSNSVTDSVRENLATGTVTRVQQETTQGSEWRSGLNLSSRLQWRLGDGGDMLMLSPTVFHSQSDGERRSVLTQSLALPATPTLYDSSRGSSEGEFTNARLNGQWRQSLAGGGRVELNGGVGGWRSRNHSQREDYRNGEEQPLRTLDDRRTTSENSVNLTTKLSNLLGGGAQPGKEHSLVAGAEIEALRRTETRAITGTGASDDGDGADNLQASSVRLAAYLQDEWNISPQWSVHAGLRWEGITTRGQADDGSRPQNQTSVATPLLHAVWKPDPKSRDQVRMSLTRSYRAPALGTLIARRAISSRYPASGANEVLSPDRIGNPDLKPELATGIDIAYERYLAAGGVLSANLFHRRITDLMRSVTTLQTVAWSPVPRWVAQTSNIGDATTQGVELEAKFRLDQLISGAPQVEMRSNLSVFRSKVDGITGPDNRLDQQAKATANLGADHRLRGTPLKLGGNLNWVPGYRTQLSNAQVLTVPNKRVLDLYGLWTFNPAAALRFTASNLAPKDYTTGNAVDTPGAAGAVRETAMTTSASHVNWQLRLELKL